MACRTRFRARNTAYVKDTYSKLEAAAIQAARRNNAALWYIPDSLAGVYQDASGTTLPALNAPIGLLLDRSYGTETLGPELLTNSDFSNGLTGWSGAGLSVSNGVATLTAATQFASFTQLLPLTVGKTYRIRAEARLGTSTSAFLKVRTNSGTNYTTSNLNPSGWCEFTFTPTEVATVVECQNLSASLGTTFWDSVSLREVIPSGSPYGPNIVVNGDFTNGTAGYSSASGAVSSIVNGNLRVTNGTASYGYSYASFPTVAGKTYLLTTSRKGGAPISSVNLHIYSLNSGAIALNLDASNPRTFVALDSQTQIQLYAGGNTVGNYTDYGAISVCEMIPASNLGPELAVNGAFDSASGWLVTAAGSNSASVSGGVGRIISSDGGYTALSQNTWAPTPGKTYLVALDVVVNSGAGLLVDFGGATSPAMATSGRKTFLLTATTTLGFVIKRNASATDATVDSLSIREVLGSHAAQATGANKPTLVRVPRKLNSELATGMWSAAAGYDNVISANTPSSFTSTGGATANRSAKVLESMVVGKTYWLSMRIASVSPGSVSVYLREGLTPGTGINMYNNPTIIATGNLFTASFVATSSTANILFVGTQGSAQNYSIDSISVREVLEWGYAFSFDGGDRLATTQTTSSSFTLIAAANAASMGWSALVSSGGQVPGNPGVRIRRNSVGEVGFDVSGTSLSNGTLLGTRLPGVPFVASTVSTGSNSLRGFIDGVGSSVVAATPQASNDFVNIGSLPTSGDWLNGSLSLVCVASAAIPTTDRIDIERFAAYLCGAQYQG